jgi:hypothetical protein
MNDLLGLELARIYFAIVKAMKSTTSAPVVANLDNARAFIERAIERTDTCVSLDLKIPARCILYGAVRHNPENYIVPQMIYSADVADSPEAVLRKLREHHHEADWRNAHPVIRIVRCDAIECAENACIQYMLDMRQPAEGEVL